MTMCGDADGMVSGATHTTAATIRPGLQVLRTKDSPLVSSVFFMCLPDKVWTYSPSHGVCRLSVEKDTGVCIILASVKWVQVDILQAVKGVFLVPQVIGSKGQ